MPTPFHAIPSPRDQLVVVDENSYMYVAACVPLPPPTSPLPPLASPLPPPRLTTPTSSPHHSHLLASPLPPPRLTTPTSSPHHSHLLASPLPPPRLTTPTSSPHHSHLLASPLPPPRLTTPTSSPHHSHLLASSSALQIFQKETHPSVYKGGGGSKEGLSLFGKFVFCDHTCTQ